MTRQARKPGWWRAYGLDDAGFVPLEAEATLERDYTLGFVPGLLQTEDYAAARFQGTVLHRTREELTNQLRIRMIRQWRLTEEDKPLGLAAVMASSVPHRPIGGPEVMRAQRAHLAEAAELDRVSFQVLPVGRGRPTGARSVSRSWCGRRSSVATDWRWSGSVSAPLGGRCLSGNA